MKKLMKKLEIDVDPKHGLILINGRNDGTWARALTTLKAYLMEIFNKHGITNSREVALVSILKGKIDGHWIIIQPPKEIREKFPTEREWRVPMDIIQMNSFYFQKISR